MFGHLVRGVVCLTGLAIADPVAATTISVAQQNSGNIFADRDGNNDWSARGTFNFDGNGNGDLTDPGDEDGVTFSGGLFRLVENPTLQSRADFLAFCFEYTQFIDLPNEYVSNSFSDPAVSAYLDALYTNAYETIFELPADPSAPTRAEKAAAFQFVLWEISLDDDLNLSDGRLEVIDAETPRLFDLATEMVTNLSSGAWVGDGSFALEYLQSDPSQDLIRANAAVAETPLPAPAWLLIGALAGLGWMRHRSL